MHADDVQTTCMLVSGEIVRSLQKRPNTTSLQLRTPEHTEAWITGVEQVIERLQKAIQDTKEKYDV